MKETDSAYNSFCHVPRLQVPSALSDYSYVDNDPAVPSDPRPRSIAQANAFEAVRKAIPTLDEYSYSLEALIGYGSNGAVLSAISWWGTRVAVKIIYKYPYSKWHNCTPNEVVLLTQVSHPNIIEFIQSFEDDSAHYLVTEYIGPDEIQATDFMIVPVTDGVSLIKIAQPSDISFSGKLEAKSTIFQIASAISQLHALGITHGDIKLQNCLAKGNEIKICDFGFASKSEFRALYGTLAYSPPELLTNVLQGRPSGREADVWAAGLVLLQLLGGSLSAQWVSGSEYPGVQDYTGSEGDLLRGMLNFDPTSRLTVDQILEHPWFQ